MKTTPLLALLLAAGCGSPGDRPACTTDANCAPGTRCQQTTEGGVCWPANTLSLDAPGANALVGGPGVTVSATLVLGKEGSTAPGTATLLAGTVAAGTLTKGTQVGSSVPYTGTYLPAPGTNGPVALAVRATVTLAQGTEQVTSPSVTLQVDTTPPAIGTPTATCAGECKRDGVLSVAAAVTDANAVTASVSLSLAPADARAMTLSAGTYQASIALKGFPFPYFSQTVTATVKAVDAAGNEATYLVNVDVTRLRWATPAEATLPPQLTGAAIDQAGRIIVGGSNSKLYFYDPNGAAPTSTAVGSIGITAAPSIGPTAVWVGSEDGRIYAVDGTGAVLNGAGCSTGSSTVGTPALSSGTGERSYTGSTAPANSFFAAGVSGPFCNATSAGEGFVSSAVVDANGKIFAATATLAKAVSVRRFSDPGTGILTGDWAASSGTDVEGPLALDASGRVLLSSLDGSLYRVTDGGSSGSASVVATLSGKARGSAVVLAGGDIAVGTVAGKVHRVSESGVAVWSTPADLGSEVSGLAAAGATSGEPAIYAVTELGKLAALQGDGSIPWSTQLAGGALRFPTIAPAQAGGLPTLYAGSADGKLYAVVVDSGLDTAAPWPKSHHDVRNTGNAAAPLP